MKTLSFLRTYLPGYLAFILLSWAGHATLAQTLPVKLVLTVTPPYPVSVSYYADHPQQVIVQMINLSRQQQSFRLVGSINGLDNNVKVVAKDRGASGVITLNPLESRPLTVAEIQDLFDSRKLAFTGINYRRTQIDDGLPEGLYTVCAYAVDAVRTNLQLSEETCSNSFPVTNLEPPILITPVADAELPVLPVQNLLFTWTVPASAPPTTEYTLQLVEVVPGMNPNNALQAATVPVFFERTVQTNTLLYGPADPPLVAGRKYAYRVTATDPMQKAVFRNGGRSEVHTFTYLSNVSQPMMSASRIRLISPSDSLWASGKIPVMEVNKQKPFGIFWFPGSEFVTVDSSQVYYETITYQENGLTKASKIRRGSDMLMIKKDLRYTMEIADANTGNILLSQTGKNLFYYSATKPLSVLKNESFYTVRITGTDTVTNKKVTQSDKVKFLYKIIPDDIYKWDVTLTMQLVYRYDSDTETYPYQGSATLRKFYAVVDTTAGKGSTGAKVIKGMIPVQQVNPSEYSSTLATANTDSDGKLTFTFNDVQQMPYMPLSGVNVKTTEKLVIRPQYVVEVNAPYFEVLKDTFLLAGDTLDAGTITLTPYSYQLTLKVEKGYKQVGSTLMGSTSMGNGKFAPVAPTATGPVKVKEAIGGLEVILYRRSNNSQGLPAMEGQKGLKDNKLSAAQILLEQTQSQLHTEVLPGSYTIGPDGKPIKTASPQEGFKGVAVASETTQIINNSQNIAEALVTFKRLLVSQQTPTDDYYIRVIDVMNQNKVMKDEKLPFDAVWFLTNGKTTGPDFVSTQVKPTYYQVRKTLTCEVTNPPTASLKGRLLYRYRDGVGASRPSHSVPVALQGSLVLHTTFGSIVFSPKDAGKSQFVGEIVKESGKVRTHTRYSFNLQNYPSIANSKVIQAAGKVVAKGTTDANGYFELKNFAIWDSVKTFPITITATILHEYIGEEVATHGKSTGIKEKYIDPRVNPNPYESYLSGSSYVSMPGYDQQKGYQQVGTWANSKQVAIGQNAVTDLNSVPVQTTTNAQQNVQQKALKAKQTGKGGPADPENWESDPENWEGAWFDENDGSISGELAFTYRLVPQLPYYLTVENDININPLESKDIGTVTSVVNDFTASIKVVAQGDKTQTGISGAALRIKRRDESPYTEVYYPKGELEETLSLSSKAIPDPNDKNKLILREKTSGETTQLMHLLPAEYTIEAYFNDSLQNQLASYTTSSEVSLSEVLKNNGIITVQKKKPVIAGRIVNKYSTQGIAGIEVNLVSLGVNTLKPVKTDKDGYFVFFDLSTDVKEWLWYVDLSTYGYKLEWSKPQQDSLKASDKKAMIDYHYGILTIQYGQMGLGDKRFIPLQAVPNAVVKTIVINEENQNIPALYKVASIGALKETRDLPNCFKPISGLANSNSNQKNFNLSLSPTESVLSGNKPSNKVSNKADNKPKQSNGEAFYSSGQMNALGQMNLSKIDATHAKVTPSANLADQVMPAKNVYLIEEFEDELGAECPQVVEALVPSAGTDTLLVVANDLRYFPEKIVVSKLKKDTNSLPPIVLKKRLHRMRFIVTTADQKNGVVPKGGLIQLLDQALPWNGSAVTHGFFNIAEDNFKVKYSPPQSSNVCVLDTIIVNAESKEWVDVILKVKEGKKINGTVMLKNQPLANARVTFDDGSGKSVAYTFSDAQGKYVLRGIEPGLKSLKLIATPPGDYPNVAGESVNVPASKSVVNFTLKPTPFNLARLVGYPIKVESYAEANGIYVISGILDMASLGGQFGSHLKALDETARIPFTNLSIRAGTKKDASGVPYAVPVPLSFKLGANPQFLLDGKYTLKVSGIMDVQAPVIGHKQGVDYAGYLSSRVQLVNNSFDLPGSYFKFGNDQFYIIEQTGNSQKEGNHKGLEQKLETIQQESSQQKPVQELGIALKEKSQWQSNLQFMPTTEKMYDQNATADFSTDYHFGDQSGNPIRFKLLEFAGKSLPEDTRYQNQAIVLQKPIVTATNVSTLDGKLLSFEIPAVTINEKGISEVKAQPGKPLIVNLEDWRLEIRDWIFSGEEGGFYSNKLTNNLLKTNFASLNFQTFRLRNDKSLATLFIDKVNFTHMKVAGAVELTLDPAKTETVFGIDSKTGADLKAHYVLKFVSKSAEPVASIKGDLLGFGKENLNFQAITLISSNQTNSLIELVPNTPKVLVDNILPFQPNGFMSSATDFTVMGTYQMGIPRLGDMEGAFRYSKSSGSKPARELQLDQEKLTFNLGKGNVVFKATGALQLMPDSLRIHGTASEEKEGLILPVILRKNAQGIIEITQEKNIASAGNPDLEIRSGKASVVASDWDYLRFIGVGTQGKLQEIQNQPLPFTVYGDIKCEGGAVKLTSITTPLGNMNLVFDYTKPRMMGTLEVKNLKLGPAGFTGSAEMMLEKPGFYVMVNGDISLPVPILSPLKAGILIGVHGAVPANVVAKTEQFNYHKGGFCTPTTDLAGIYLCGRKDIIKPSQNGFALGPVAVRFGYQVGADASLLLNFTALDDQPQFQLMAGAFGKGFLEMSSITCTTLDFKGEVNLLAKIALINLDQGLGALNASVLSTINLEGKLVQKIPVPSLSEGISCEGSLFSFDKTVNVYAIMEIANGKPSVDFALEKKDATGNCELIQNKK
ncbi:carboxypeptidase-like regulatory domain-containing protein [Cytophagaceae bacterium DM2B3-1]|uniref:Carboxypeptidase-like regulatory domain-containing protein n=1 Tax=Xanthocytophaga flava TaxID=3048013 RepID=A0ABT7CH40_9BACT|nr:carboxypeptidase-like regulatory domain-containing protein [Xanthocytophaga flavus]MDJ1493066.1 carboxypeptidase-like regulatory domain-containing protein [Xanthocytophaga flavus]